MERKIICNRIITPDGTELISHHVHDFNGHEDKNDNVYYVDGGKEYLRRVGPSDYTEASIYSDDSFEVIREHLYRGSRGKDGMQELEYIKLKDMSDEHLKATIIYNDRYGYGASYNTYYEMEIQYRKDNNITVKE